MNYRGNFWASIPAVTKHLLIINCIMWLGTIVLRHSSGIDLTQWLGLHYWQASDFNPAQLLTYMFMHDTSGIAHLFFNMFSLWMFGVTLERVLGQKRYFFYYMACGVGAAIVQELTWTLTWQGTFVPAFASLNSLTADQVTQLMDTGQINAYVDAFQNSLVTVGASGAVFGILLAFGMIFPNMPMYIIPFPFPIKAKWMVLGYGAVELLFGVASIMESVAHFAHLGGMIFGFFIIWYWKRNGTIQGGFGNGYY
ncbi:MAG: rhomboid family intramembrane serine protease [Muribaculaceae bacterium]|nr:rhomboid family intramembrane serine protease [Muribaculaceae bacterium]